ncbi:unnamed protein product, partial [Anisakis simplex]|uniref:Uncharacterized protein n=1 Tax=Anisakis simplex TaxID=6269 RepID=A0A0M3JFD5_ANISI
MFHYRHKAAKRRQRPTITNNSSIHLEKNIASEKQDSTRSSSTSSKGWSVERDHSTVSTPQATETASATTVNSLSAQSGTYDGVNSYNNDGAMVTGTTPDETAHQNGGMTDGTAAVHTPEQTQRVDEQRYHSEPPMSMV